MQPTLATLKPVVKLKVVDKTELPEHIRYTMTLYTDQRLELTGMHDIEKIGGHTTMLTDIEYKRFMASLHELNRGHFIFDDKSAKEIISYDVVFYPLKKDMSMADGIQLPKTPKMDNFTTQLSDYLSFKKWINRDNAPKILSDKDAGNILTTLKIGTLPKAVESDPKYSELKFKAIRQTDVNTNTWLFSFGNGFSTADAVYKIKSHQNVLGAIPNTIVNKVENMKFYENQELIVQFKEKVNIDEWIKAYAQNNMKAIEQIAPDLNYWTVSYNSSTLSAKEMIARIKLDSKVSEAQINKKVSIRE